MAKKQHVEQVCQHRPQEGEQFRHRVNGTRIEEVLTAPHSPWHDPLAERSIGSVRRECLDHVVSLSSRHLCRILTAYFAPPALFL